MSKIKGITVVTAVGANSYNVGICGVTAIISDSKSVSSDCRIDIYTVWKGAFMAVEISAFCPLEIEYEEETK